MKSKVIDPEIAAFGEMLLGSVKEMKAGKSAKKTLVKASPVVEARLTSGLSQERFAVLLGISVRTLQKWEQGQREPSGAAKTLIRIAQKHPKVLISLST